MKSRQLDKRVSVIIKNEPFELGRRVWCGLNGDGPWAVIFDDGRPMVGVAHKSHAPDFSPEKSEIQYLEEAKNISWHFRHLLLTKDPTRYTDYSLLGFLFLLSLVFIMGFCINELFHIQ